MSVYRESGRPPAAEDPGQDVRCLYCGAAHATGTVYCATCGVALPDIHEPDDGAVLACPRCSKPLAMSSLDPEEWARHCASCGGLFVAARAWTELLARANLLTVAIVDTTDQPPLSRDRLFAIVRCPRCGREMERASFAVNSAVLVDICMMHGIWFDAGELFAVVEWLEQHPASARRQPRIDDDPPPVVRELDGNAIYERLVALGSGIRILK